MKRLMRPFLKFVHWQNVNMKYTSLLFLLFFISIQTVSATEIPVYSTKYDPMRDALQDGRDAIKLASASNRLILIELGGDWCKWCHFMDRFLKDNPDVKKELHETFVVLKVNVSEKNYNDEFLKVFPKPYGYPHMYITKSDGTLLHSKDTGQFVVNGKYSAQRFKEFFRLWAMTYKSLYG